MAYPPRDEIKICDFGFCQEIDTSRHQYSMLGTPEFVAPEVVHLEPVTVATDIWWVSSTLLGNDIFYTFAGCCCFYRPVLLIVPSGLSASYPTYGRFLCLTLMFSITSFTSHDLVPRQSCVPLPVRGRDRPGHAAQSRGGNPQLGRPRCRL